MNVFHFQLRLILFCLFFALIFLAIGQRSGNRNSSAQLEPVSQTYALTGVMIVQAPDKQAIKGTVLIKDGIIQAAGPNVSIPGEAQVMELDSMYVYAGFIDGMSHTGIPKPKAQEQQRGQRGGGRSDAANPPNEDAGIQPEREVLDLLDPKDPSIAAMRKIGFTTVHVVPRGKMLPGSGAVVLLAGSSADDMIFANRSSLFSQFVTASGVYPNTLLGIMAKWRDLYRQAGLAQSHEAAYAKNPAGMKRPSYDRVITALFPVLSKELPVFFKTEKALDAYRAMTLAKDLGFSLVLTGVKQGWDLTDEIQSANIPVFLSLDLPKAEKSEKEKEEKSEMTDLEKERQALQKRKAEAYAQSCRQAATFAKAGIPFGFASEGAKAKEIQANLRTMIEHGLTEEQALAALTTQAAQLLGLSQVMGTVEAGKMANLVISDQSIFSEKSNVRYVFVEGQLFEIAKPKPKKKGSADAPAAAVAGKWSYTVETPQGTSSGILTISGEDGVFSGTISNEMMGGAQELSSVELEGSELTFTFSFDADGQVLNIEGVGTIDGTEMEGTMLLGGFGEAPFEAQKTGDPE